MIVERIRNSVLFRLEEMKNLRAEQEIGLQGRLYINVSLDRNYT